MPPSPTEPSEGPGDGGQASVQFLLDEADALLRAGELDEAMQLAVKAVGLRVDPGRAMPALARILEAQGDFSGALEIYRQAMALKLGLPEISGEMGRLALRIGKFDVAEAVLSVHVKEAPATPRALANLGLAQAMVRGYDRAQATLTAALEAHPEEALLWLTLGQVLCFQGRHAQAIVFFGEALRFDPAMTPALDGVADALLLGAGDVEQALSASEAAVASARADEIVAMTAAHARRLLAAGRLGEGWTAFAKAMEPGEAAAIEVKVAAPPWRRGMTVNGRLLLIGEQSPVEAILLAQVIPDLIADSQPLILAVEPHWRELARRSFPEATLVPLLERQRDGRRQQAADLDSAQRHNGELVAAWAPLRSMVRFHRERAADFAGARPYLKADPERVAHWRKWLAGLGTGPKVGVVWRPPPGERGRAWEAPPLPLLRAALAVPGVHLIGIQDEELQNELGWIRETFDLPILDPPPDLVRRDLDDLAALALAMDVVVGPPDTAACLAAACGAQTWFLASPRHWALLGAETYPWFPKARVMSAAAPDDWMAALTELNRSLIELAGRSATA